MTALFVALGGTGYAGTTLLSSTAAKKKSGDLKQDKKFFYTKGQSNKRFLGASATAVAALNANNAAHATSADSATNAGHATSADSATNATNATNATHATSADTAGDSSKLGGVAAAQYETPTATLQSGNTEHGVFAGGGGASAYINLQIQFDPDLPANLDTAHIIRVTGASATHCPGTGQAEAGYLCWYEKASSAVTFTNFGDPVRATTGANKEGMNVFYSTTGASAYVYGEWAVTAP